MRHKKRAYHYIRVSCDKQVKEGYSLEEQKVLLNQHSTQLGYDVVGICVDAGISGKDIEHRPGMKKLLREIAEDRVDVVVAWRLSRTFRNLRELLETLELMKEHNVIFDFVGEQIIDPNSSYGTLYAQILGMVAELERETIASNVYMGMAAAAKQGKYLAGTPPFGYDLETISITSKSKRDRKLIINEEEAAVVRRIFDMFVNGDEEFPSGAGYKHICNTLNHEGILTKQGKAFSIGTISGIIQNPIYYGVVRWGGHRKWSEKRRKGTVEPILARGTHEPIISEELFKKAEAIRIAKGGRCQRKYTETKNILTGILKCPKCGAGMVLSRAGTTGKKISYYGCGNWHNKGTAVCNSNLVSLDEVNEIVLNKVSEICSDELIVRGVLKRLNNTKNNKIEGSEKDQEDLQKMIEKTQRDIISLQLRFESDSCDIDAQEYKRRIKELRATEEAYNTSLSELKETLSKYQAEKTYTIEELREVFSRIREVLDKADVVELRTLMHLMIESISINPDSKLPDGMIIKFNTTLTNYLCINNEEEANKTASSFSVVKHKELRFKVDL